MEQGPSKGLYDVTLLSADRRLRGRPRLCSDCGLCDSFLRPRMTELCPFVDNRAEAVERRIHGRLRSPGEEMRFGIHREMLAARMREPRPGAQWSGMVTGLAARLLERGLTDAVLLTGTRPGTRFAPLPVLACTPAEVLVCAGNKPALSPNLGLLDRVRGSGIRRLTVVGTGCQIQALRQSQLDLGAARRPDLGPDLVLERLDLIGIPCSDNVAYEDQQRFIRRISRSPETVVHYEFMQDYSLWLHHDDGQRERVDYVDFPMDELQGIFPSACLACFDYPNTLCDLTIGYMGAPLGWQWVLVRTDRGAELLDLLRPDLELLPLEESGDRRRGMPRFVASLAKRPARPPWPVRRLVAYLQRSHGPRGLEFARAIVEMKLLRNLVHVRDRFPTSEARVVPYHVYESLRPYAGLYSEVFGRELEPVGGPPPAQPG